MKKIYFICFIYFFSMAAAYQPMIVISIPKCGSFLACKLMKKLTGKILQGLNIDCSGSSFKRPDPKYFYWGHVLAIQNSFKLLAQCKAKILFIMRNPLDQIVSYSYANKGYKPINEVIMELIIDNSTILKSWEPHRAHLFSHVHTIVDYYNLFLGWVNKPNVYVTTFEKLVGPKGGGDAQMQRQEIINIANHFSIPLNETTLQEIIDTLFGDTHTFREGQIGSWKKEFKEEHIQAFKDVGGNQLLIDLGYEPI